LTTAEAAALLGMTDSGVRRLILTGRLKAQRAGKRVLLIRRADLAGVQRSKAGRKKKSQNG
jgi:excisionase family DNA binding protein